MNESRNKKREFVQRRSFNEDRSTKIVQRNKITIITSVHTFSLPRYKVTQTSELFSIVIHSDLLKESFFERIIFERILFEMILFEIIIYLARRGIRLQQERPELYPWVVRLWRQRRFCLRDWQTEQDSWRPHRIQGQSQSLLDAERVIQTILIQGRVRHEITEKVQFVFMRCILCEFG